MNYLNIIRSKEHLPHSTLSGQDNSFQRMLFSSLTRQYLQMMFLSGKGNFSIKILLENIRLSFCIEFKFTKTIAIFIMKINSPDLIWP